MTTHLVKKLVELAQLDIDAIEAYSQAIEKIEDQMIRNHLIEFQADHKRHVSDLSVYIRQLGGEPPDHADIKGLLIEGFTAIRSLMGSEGAMKAMKSNEELTTKTYQKALQEEAFSPEIKTLIERNFADEQRHLAYIMKNLEKF